MSPGGWMGDSTPSERQTSRKIQIDSVKVTEQSVLEVAIVWAQAFCFGMEGRVGQPASRARWVVRRIRPSPGGLERPKCRRTRRAYSGWSKPTFLATEAKLKSSFRQLQSREKSWTRTGLAWRALFSRSSAWIRQRP